jgi:hypothetical protein
MTLQVLKEHAASGCQILKWNFLLVIVIRSTIG